MSSRALALAVMLAAGSSSAQVAAVCGPGKKCNARSFTASGPAGEVPFCFTNTTQSGFSYGWSTSTSNATFGVFGNNTCSGSLSTTVGRLNFNLNAPAISALGTSYFSSAQGYAAPLAFASFPACDATTAGRMLFDSTNNVWRYCVNALGWVAVQGGSADVQTIYSPANVVTNNPIAQWASSPLVGAAVGTTVSLQAATVLTAGVGAGNITYTVYDLSAAANTTAAVTIACTTAAGTVTTGSTDSTLRAFPNNYQLRVTASACATNPVVNVTVRNVAY